jgi:hypothetical protein
VYFEMENILLFSFKPIKLVARSKALTVFKHWGCEFESHSRHGCLSAFILFVLFCVRSGLATV